LFKIWVLFTFVGGMLGDAGNPRCGEEEEEEGRAGGGRGSMAEAGALELRLGTPTPTPVPVPAGGGAGAGAGAPGGGGPAGRGGWGLAEAGADLRRVNDSLHGGDVEAGVGALVSAADLLAVARALGVPYADAQEHPEWEVRLWQVRGATDKAPWSGLDFKCSGHEPDATATTRGGLSPLSRHAPLDDGALGNAFRDVGLDTAPASPQGAADVADIGAEVATAEPTQSPPQEAQEPTQSPPGPGPTQSPPGVRLQGSSRVLETLESPAEEAGRPSASGALLSDAAGGPASLCTGPSAPRSRVGSALARGPNRGARDATVNSDSGGGGRGDGGAEAGEMVVRETPEQGVVGPLTTAGELVRLAVGHARAEREVLAVQAPVSARPTQMVSTQLVLRPRKKGLKKESAQQAPAFRPRRAAAAEPEGAPVQETRVRAPRGEATAAPPKRARPRKGAGPFGCSKCRWASFGCGSCNPEKKGKAASRKRARALAAVTAGGVQWMGPALRDEVPPPPLPELLAHPLASGSAAPARVRFFKGFILGSAHLELGDFVELQAPGAADDRPVVGRLEALWEESAAPESVTRQRAAPTKFARCRRFYYVSEVSNEEGAKGAGVLSSDVILDRVALEHVARGCTVEAEGGGIAVVRGEPGRYSLRGHFDILSQSWTSLRA